MKNKNKIMVLLNVIYVVLLIISVILAILNIKILFFIILPFYAVFFYLAMDIDVLASHKQMDKALIFKLLNKLFKIR